MNQHLFAPIQKNKASSRVLFERIGRLFILLALLLSPLGRPSTGVTAAAETISYLGSLGTAVSKTSGTSLVITTTAAVTNGDDILVAVATDPNSSLVVSLADTAGNNYIQVGSTVINSGKVRTYLFAAYNANSMASGSSITVTASPAVTARAAVAALFSGLADSSPLDQTKSGTGNDTAPTSGASSTTTQADELLIGVVGTEGPDGDNAGTWDNSFTAGPRLGTTGGTADTNITVSLGYRIVSATGAYTTSKTGITSRYWGAMLATFMAGSGTNPAIYTTGTPLSAFSSLPGGLSAEQTYSVSGSNLTGAITITAPADFQISLSSGTGFASSLVLSPSGGTVPATPIFVRFGRATEGASSGNITHTSSGALARNVAVSGTAAPLSPVSFNILLGRPEDVSITANIIPDKDVEFYVEYGTSTSVYTAQTAHYTATANQVVEFVIGSLTANTRYFYRIVYHQSGVTEWNNAAEHSFITQRPTGSSFTFTVTSDDHLGQYGGVTTDELALWQKTLVNIATDNPDFHIDMGDTFPMDPSPLGTGMTDAEAKAAYYYDRPSLGAITSSIPYFQALGNHENEEGWNFDDVFTAPDQSLAHVGMKYRKLYYPNPIPDSFYSGNTDITKYGVIGDDALQEDYWAWTWGDALFVVIDPYHYSMTWPNDDGQGYGGEGQDGEASGTRWDWSLGIQQYLWFKSTLENSHAKYKFVFAHHVTGGASVYGRGGKSASTLFEWGGRNADGTWGWDTHRPASEGWTVPVHQLMVDNGVNVFFHGHDHDYAREEVDGIEYIECAKPDDAGYTWDPYSYGHNENLYPDATVELQNSGYLRVSVTPANTKVEYVRSYLPGDGTNGTVADSVTVSPNASKKVRDDYDGDGKTDAVKFDPAAGIGWWLKSSTGLWDGKWLGSDTFAYVSASDFDGDGKTDPAKFYSGTGTVWWVKSSTGIMDGQWLGPDLFTYITGSDFDGDGKADPAKFYSGTGTVWWVKSTTGILDGQWLGPDLFTYISGSDFDGDGRSDPAKFYPGTGTVWWVKSSTHTMDGKWLGADTFSYVPASDFDGDGRTDPAKFYSGTGNVWWVKSSTGSMDGAWMGSGTFTYVPGCDFNGDGKTDPARFDASTHTLSWLNVGTGTWTDLDTQSGTYTLANGQ